MKNCRSAPGSIVLAYNTRISLMALLEEQGGGATCKKEIDAFVHSAIHEKMQRIKNPSFKLTANEKSFRVNNE